MMTKNKNTRNSELRNKVREAAAEGASVEFKPSEDSIAYLFGLKDLSCFGLGFLAPKNSTLFASIEVGQVISLKLFKGNVSPDPDLLKAKICHISEQRPGTDPGQMVVGLSILSQE
ncbi:MAG: hypothetical protein HUK40_05270 [Desulfobacter sp.]|nr:hypothetical protein [Desulfobacter sp.]WDP87461.1 MAG: hypothetical protein HUN05_21940 [Desulfobacter sp.]